MTAWFKAEYFNADTKVRIAGSSAEFKRVGDRTDCAWAGQASASTEKAKEKKEKAKEKAAEDATTKDAADSAASTTAADSTPADESDATAEPVKVLHKWFYLDDENLERGPWSEKQMTVWCKKGFFETNNRVRRDDNETWQLLSEFEETPSFAVGIVRPKPVPMHQIFPHGQKGFPPHPGMMPFGMPPRPGMPLRPGMPGQFRPPQQAPPQNAPAPQKAQGLQSEAQQKPQPPGEKGDTDKEEEPKKPEEPKPKEEPKWVYLDKDEKTQGPWTSQQMREWFSAGLLSLAIRVKEDGSDGPFVPIGARPCCFTVPKGAPIPQPPAMGRGGPQGPPFGGPRPFMPRPPQQFMGRPPFMMGRGMPPQGQNYAQQATFNKRTGKFDSAVGPGGPMDHWQRKGLAPDSAGRQMGHFFNHDEWQKKKNEENAKKQKLK